MSTSLGFALINSVLATSNVLLRESRRFFRPLGVTEAQFNVLNVLAGAPDGMSQRELSDVLVVDRSNVTTLLDRMEKSGLVRRADHPSDRRIYQVFLTEKGRKLWARVHPLYLRAVAHVTGRLSARQMQECSETLRALAASAAKWREN